jgi:hypothetical protein
VRWSLADDVNLLADASGLALAAVRPNAPAAHSLRDFIDRAGRHPVHRLHKGLATCLPSWQVRGVNE